MSDDSCSVCGAARIPGISSCVNCGEPFTPVTIDILPPDGMEVASPEEMAQWATEHNIARQMARSFTEARALEYAGDVDGAILIYESMLAQRAVFTDAYKRLAILYRKLKRPADEERVVRSVLAFVPCGPNSWYVLRLAKILADRKKQTDRATKPPEH